MTPLAYLKIGIAVVLLAIITFLTYRLNEVKGELKKTAAELADTSVKLKFQNNLVLDLKTAGDKKVKEAQDELEKARLQAANQKQKADIIYKTLPADPNNDCKSALELGNQQ